MGERQSSNDGLIDDQSQKGSYRRPGDEACCFAWIWSSNTRGEELAARDAGTIEDRN